MYIIDKTTGDVLCSGIIITTNLLATSHECLQLSQRRYNVFDAWFSRTNSRNMLEISRLGISKSSSTQNQQFEVVQVIYNHRHGIYLATSSHPHDNMVLIQVTPEFTSDPDLITICIPESADEVGEVGLIFNL